MSEEIDKRCIDCKLRDRIRFCPKMLMECLYYDDAGNIHKNKNKQVPGVPKAGAVETDRELE